MYFLQHVNRVFLRSEPIKNFSSFSVIPKAPYIERSYRDSIVIYFVYKKKGDKGVIFADMEIDHDKLAAAILRQQQRQQPSVRLLLRGRNVVFWPPFFFGKTAGVTAVTK